jgi:manganese/iron transport system permease protein/iron/zinc/copper transport system permease protein
VSRLTDPFAYEFFARAMLSAVPAAAACGALGAYVVVRRMSYVAHGLSHAVIGGAAIAAVLGLDVLAGAAVWALLSALAIDRVARHRSLYADTAIGIVTTTSFAVGVAVISRADGVRLNLEGFLFGSILGVTTTDLIIAVGAAVLVGAVVLTRFRPLLFVTFDPEVAATHGLRIGRYEALFALLLTAGVVSAMRVLGVLLVAAAIVIPPAAARLLTNRFELIVVGSSALGALSAVIGLYASWYLDLAPGPCIVLVQAGAFAACWAVAAHRDGVVGPTRPASRQPGPGSPGSPG